MPSRFWKASGNALLPSSNTFSTAAAGGAFTPASISGLDLWIEADPAKLYTDAGTTLVSADGQAVYQASNKTTGLPNLEQPTLGNRPLYKTDLTKPSLQFSGSQWLQNPTGSASLTVTDGAGQFWVAISGSVTSTSSIQNLITFKGAAGYTADYYVGGGSQGHMETRNTGGAFIEDATAASTVVAGTNYVFIGTVITGAAEAFVDNVSNGSSALSGTLQTQTCLVAVGSDLGANSVTGRIFGICHGTGTLSATDRGNLQTYLAGLHP